MNVTSATIIFDLDGTLVDSVPDLANALDRLMVEEGLPTIGRARARDLIGHGIGAFIKSAFSFHRVPLDETRQSELVRRFKSIYAEALADETIVYPLVPEVLSGFRDHGFRMGVCTNKDEIFARAILAQLGLESYFSVVAGPDTFGFTKPDPRHLTATIAAVGGDGPTIYVGDSDVDARTAIAAHVPMVILRHGYCKVPHESLGADLLIDGFAELPAAVATLVAEVERCRA
ncbi:HAD-IA family hydrolase [Rhizobium alvei]|uniref:phosphoglycolate phosphatase n=1 Tax=Rhizobium alvei TaxID=1132659 RepID=A0ABT8YUD0_9HYPH|nr:HAD-IA family hydrolase [Rhizobium alvei]MDO6966922.1 HAD-IA family hydrolase [Rhizobium alvei]